MESLFVVEGNSVIPQPEVLLLEPFSNIWKAHPKPLAIDIIAYIYFMVSYAQRNVFAGYPKEQRAGKILSTLPSGPEIDQLISNNLIDTESPMQLLKELQQEASVSMRFYESAIEAAEKMIRFFNEFSFSERSPKTGLPLYKPADITRALKETTEVLKTLQGLREKVQQELLESSRATKQRQVNPFER